MSDLDGMFRESLKAVRGTSTDERRAQVVATVIARASRKRRVRAAGAAAAAVVGTLLVVSGAYGITQRANPPVAGEPTPSASPTPTSGAIGRTAPCTLADVGTGGLASATLPGLAPNQSLLEPCARDLTPGVVDKITTGWRVGLYRIKEGTTVGGVDELSVVMAVAPDGTVFRGAAVSGYVSPVLWRGDLGALVVDAVVDALQATTDAAAANLPHETRLVDPVTGQSRPYLSPETASAVDAAFQWNRLTAGPNVPPWDRVLVGRTSAGREVWAGNTRYGTYMGFALVDPDGTVTPAAVNDRVEVLSDKLESPQVGFDAAAGEMLVITGASPDGLAGGRYWLLDVAHNTVTEVTPSLPAGQTCRPVGGLGGFLEARGLAVWCSLGTASPTVLWLPLDGSPAVPAGAANFDTTAGLATVPGDGTRGRDRWGVILVP